MIEQFTSIRNYVNCLKRKSLRETLAINTEINLREKSTKLFPIEDLIDVEVDDHDKKVRIGVTLSME